MWRRGAQSQAALFFRNLVFQRFDFLAQIISRAIRGCQGPLHPKHLVKLPLELLNFVFYMPAHPPEVDPLM
jgi:hypothetical protein